MIFQMHQLIAMNGIVGNRGQALIFRPGSIVEAEAMAKIDSNQTASQNFRQKPFGQPKYFGPITLETTWPSHACMFMRRNASCWWI